MPGPPNVTTVCGTSSGMNARCGGLAASISATGGEAGLGRQSAEGLVEQLAERDRVDIADRGNPQRILGQHAADVVLHVSDIDLRNAFQGAVGLPAVGMVAKGDFQEFAAGQRGRIGGVAPQPGKNLRANALVVGALEMRRRQRHPQQVEGLVLVILEHAQAAAEIIPRRTEAQFDGAAVKAFMERLGIEIARALIEQIGDHVADAGFAGRVLGRAAAEGIFHRDQRHGGVLHEPGLDAAGRNQTLDLGRGLRWRRRQRRHGEAGSENESNAPRANLGAKRLVTNASPRASARHP